MRTLRIQHTLRDACMQGRPYRYQFGSVSIEALHSVCGSTVGIRNCTSAYLHASAHDVPRPHVHVDTLESQHPKLGLHSMDVKYINDMVSLER